ncbi:hypothetical protein MRX96_049022 [Rhipicephalus microplus]
MIDFFCQYIKGDKIGLIANAHLVWADLLDAGINSHRCRDLARKCSVNLDFAKCGDLKGLQNSEKPPMYPDFMEKQGAKNTYCSRKVLGQLYRNCKKFLYSWPRTFREQYVFLAPCFSMKSGYMGGFWEFCNPFKSPHFAKSRLTEHLRARSWQRRELMPASSESAHSRCAFAMRLILSPLDVLAEVNHVLHL